jgi:hypothetical protein
MTKEQFLTVRWNNVLALALGIPIFLFAVVVLSTSVVPIRTGFIVFAIMGAVY